METWFVGLVGLFLTGYLVLDGAAFGVGMLCRRLSCDDAQCRLLLNAVGPFFLGNEVWVVAFVGLLLGAFPRLEAALLTGWFPLFVPIVGALILRDGGMWLRSHGRSPAARRRWDRVITASSVALPVGWGLVLGNLAQGLPAPGTTSAPALLGPYPLLCGLALAVLTAAHGAVFLALRLRGPAARHAADTARRLLPVGGGLLVLVLGGGFLAARLGQPVTAALLTAAALVALWLARRFLDRSPAGAFAATACAVGLPVVAVGAGQAPALAATAATGSTLVLLAQFLVVALPVLALGQIWLWRTFAGPVTPASPQYF
jgi:cytochrome bd ubiquinol oxidase subunit II